MSKTLRKKFGLDGGEFLNTGCTLEEWCATLELEKVHRCYSTQSRTEQKHRLHYVVRLAVEGSRVRALDQFGSAVVEMAIECVIGGDWDAVSRYIEWCKYEGTLAPPDGSERCADYPNTVLAGLRAREHEYAELWTPFRQLLVQAHAGREENAASGIRH